MSDMVRSITQEISPSRSIQQGHCIIWNVPGPIVRVAPNRYDFNTLEAAKTIYRIANQFPKSKYYVPFGSPHGDNLLNTLDNAPHSAMKRQVASLYSMCTLLSYETAVDRQTYIMRKKLDEFASTGELVDIPRFLQYYALT